MSVTGMPSQGEGRTLSPGQVQEFRRLLTRVNIERRRRHPATSVLWELADALQDALGREATAEPSPCRSHVLPAGFAWGDCQHLNGTRGVSQVKSGFVDCTNCMKIVARGCSYCGFARPIG
ncbi:hypothetical protein K1T35_48195 (plasmid) [Pseudonocardia sp. DSM 110487]|uniref:hypothetical protein n=1 Tax=Pseudonocardia sp. DSM 110487 TaxID=2865833 RepID=UPI001C69EC72|nr:hypothetical protein [Pseudonocardia sp. DSM 110487]QYN41131.1 hypothetical protein K1T35_48195 [Pseudonocardia sp. DSM 110487]